MTSVPEDARTKLPAFAQRSLCSRCRHVALVTTDKGSTFLRCTLADTDPRFPKYPRQPVLACRGFGG
jgi:hypothetical protein